MNYLPLRQNTPYRTRSGERITLTPTSGGMLVSSKGYLYLPTNPNIHDTESPNDIVGVHLEEGVWLTASGYDRINIIKLGDDYPTYPFASVDENGRKMDTYTDRGTLYVASETPLDLVEYICPLPRPTWIRAIESGYLPAENTPIPPMWQPLLSAWANLCHTHNLDNSVFYDPDLHNIINLYPTAPQFNIEQEYLRQKFYIQSDRTPPIYNGVPQYHEREDGTVYVVCVSPKFIKGGYYNATTQPDYHTSKFHLRFYNTPFIHRIGATYNPLTNWYWEIEREVERRIMDEEYTPVPEGFPNKFGTGVHISTQNPNLLAYYPTFRHWQRRVPQQIKAGRYIRQYFPEYSDDEVRRLSAMVGTGELRFYSRWQDMLDAYLQLDEDGVVSSCMSKDDWGTMHPLMVYDNSDVELAVLYMGDKPVARALYNKHNKHFPMVYGHWEKMAVALSNAGFVHDSLNGATIRRLPRYVSSAVSRDTLDLDNIDQYAIHSDYILMPYIDHKRDLDRSHNCSTMVTVYSDHCVIDYRGEFDANNYEGGYISIAERMNCESCGDRVDADDTVYLDIEGISVCECCNRNYVVEVITFGRRDNIYCLEDTAQSRYIFIDYNWYEDTDAAQDAGYRWSEADDEWYHEDDCVWVEELEDYIHDSEIGKSIVYDEQEHEYITMETHNEREQEREQEQSEAA